MSELTTRILAALVAAPLALAMIYLGGLPLAAFLAVLSAGCAWELYRMARNGGVDPVDPVDPVDALGMPLAGAIPLLVHAASIGVYRVTLAVAAVALLVRAGDGDLGSRNEATPVGCRGRHGLRRAVHGRSPELWLRASRVSVRHR